MKLGKEIPVARLFPEYKRWIENGRPFADVESELVDFVSYAAHFRKLVAPKDDTPLSRFAKRIKAIDVSTVYPLVLSLAEDSRLTQADRVGIFIDLESFLIRRLVCGRTAKNYNRLFLQLLAAFQAIPEHSRANFQTLLLAGTGEAVDWPSDADFRASWLALDAYRDLKAARVEVILHAIEEDLWDRKTEKITVHGDLTIEHVMPKEWRTNWPLPSEVDAEAASQARDEAIQSFGNLTLLTQSLNSSVRNSAAASKLPKIAQQSALRLNSHFQQRATWTEADISERSELLFRAACRVWPRPTSTVATPAP